MTTDMTLEEIANAEANGATPAPNDTVETPVVEPDPLREELDRVQKRGEGKTELEKALFTRQRLDARIAELKGESNVIVEPAVDDDEDKPVTMGMLKKMRQEEAQKSALQLAEELPTETERELAKFHLKNTIRSSGNPQQDFELVVGLVNAAKNKQVLEHVANKPAAKTHSSGSSAPARVIEEEVLTPDELQFTRPPFNMSKADIIKARVH